MDITIAERAVGRVTVLDIVGKLTLDQAAQRLQDRIDDLIVRHRIHIILNLKFVPYIDSGGLGQMVASYAAVKKEGGALKLLHVGARNQDLLSMTQLVTLFQSFGSEAEAVESFEPVATSTTPQA